jgi:hypothetical protein
MDLPCLGFSRRIQSFDFLRLLLKFLLVFIAFLDFDAELMLKVHELTLVELHIHVLFIDCGGLDLVVSFFDF